MIELVYKAEDECLPKDKDANACDLEQKQEQEIGKVWKQSKIGN